MLTSMPGNAAVSASAKTGSFASLLEGFTATPRPDPYSKDDGLEDDIAIISYEQTLRSHARIRPVPDPLPVSSAIARSVVRKPSSGQRIKSPGRKQSAAVSIEEWARQSAPPQAAPRKPRKSASVTIRLTPEECAQLRERAAAAGLTTSAYLRSCLLEAEALRAHVKEVLEQFRTAAAPVEAKRPSRAEGTGDGLLQSPVRGLAHDAASGAAHAAPTRRWWLPSLWLRGKHTRVA